MKENLPTIIITGCILFLVGLVIFGITSLPDLGNNGYAGHKSCYQLGIKVLDEDIIQTANGLILHNGKTLHASFNECQSSYDYTKLVPLKSWVTQ